MVQGCNKLLRPADRESSDNRGARDIVREAQEIMVARIERVYERATYVRAIADGAHELAERLRVGLASDAAPEHGPMAQLARSLGLDSVECDVVWSIVACSYDPRTSSHVEAIVGASARRGMSVSAYIALSGIDSARGMELSRWLASPSNALVSTGLLVASEPASPAERAYVASARLVGFLAGSDTPDPPIRLVRADRALIYDDDQIASIELIGAALERSPDPLVVIEGPVGSGRATACARASGRDMLVLDLQRVPGNELFAAIMGLRREALLRPCIPVLANVDHLLGEEMREQRRLLGDFIDRVSGPLIVTVTVRGTDLATERPAVRVPWDVPKSDVRKQLWIAATLSIRASIAGDLSTLAYRYRVGPAAIERAVSSIRLLHPRGVPLDEVALATGLRHNIAERLGALARRVEVTQTWDDLVVADDTSDRLREIIGRIKHSFQVLETWGYRKRMALGAGVPVLFSGPPGTGKTMVAGLIARELDLELYQVDISKVVSKWVGETEKNLARVFDAAEHGHALLLFDEADSLFGQRTPDAKTATDRYANLEVNYLLQRVEAFGGITILTTNMDTAIDDAIKRRLAAHVRFERPDEDERARLWTRNCNTGRAPVDKNVDYDALAKMFPNMSGANIRNAAISAAFMAAADGSSRITQDYLMRAGRAEYSSMGHVLSDLRPSKPRSSL